MSGAAAPALSAEVTAATTSAGGAATWAARGRVVALAAGSGLGMVAAVPPWGWWPAAFVGIALFDRLIAGRSRRSRFLRGWLAAVFWLAPGMVWMLDLTAPGYPLAVAVFGAFFGLGAAAVPAGPGRRIRCDDRRPARARGPARSTARAPWRLATTVRPSPDHVR